MRIVCFCLLLTGCVGAPDELEVGVGREFNGGGFALSSDGGGYHGDALSVDFDEEDSTTAWAALVFDLGPEPKPEERIIYVEPPAPPPKEEPKAAAVVAPAVVDPEPHSHEDHLDVILSLIAGAITALGAKSGYQTIREKRRKGTHGKKEEGA